MQKLNLGCGTTAPVGWINIDRSPGLLISRIPGLRRLLRATGLLPEPQSAVEWPGNIRMPMYGVACPFRAELWTQSTPATCSNICRWKRHSAYFANAAGFFVPEESSASRSPTFER